MFWVTPRQATLYQLDEEFLQRDIRIKSTAGLFSLRLGSLRLVMSRLALLGESMIPLSSPFGRCTEFECMDVFDTFSVSFCYRFKLIFGDTLPELILILRL